MKRKCDGKRAKEKGRRRERDVIYMDHDEYQRQRLIMFVAEAAAATDIRVAGLLKLRATFVSPIVAESPFAFSLPIGQIVSEGER